MSGFPVVVAEGVEVLKRVAVRDVEIFEGSAAHEVKTPGSPAFQFVSLAGLEH